jgi:phosphohistidine phosphatase
MDLILWRHAQAADALSGHSDLERELTAKGRRQAERVAAWLQRHLPSDAVVLASPARRTVQTVQALDRDYRTDEALGPERDAHDLLAAVGWPKAGGTVLVVGHQPTLGRVAASLLAGVEQPWSVRKGALWWLRQRRRAGSRETVLLAVHDADGVP